MANVEGKITQFIGEMYISLYNTYAYYWTQIFRQFSLVCFYIFWIVGRGLLVRTLQFRDLTFSNL